MKLATSHSALLFNESQPNENLQTQWDEVAIEMQSAFLSERALNGDPLVQGLSYLVLSRMLQNQGDLRKALSLANQAVDKLSCSKGRIEFASAALQRAHVHFELGNDHEVESELQTVRFIHIPAVQETVKALNTMRGRNTLPIRHELLLNHWGDKLERWKRQSQSISLGKLEKQVLQKLMVKPRTKREMIKELYGSLLDYDVLENRFKNLLRRIRKKLPDTIEFDNGFYSVINQKAIYQKCNLT